MNNVSTKIQIRYKLQNRSMEEHFILIIGWKLRNINYILVFNFCNLGIRWWFECTNDGLSPMSKRICYFLNDVRFIATFIDKWIYIWTKSTSMSDGHEQKKTFWRNITIMRILWHCRWCVQHNINIITQSFRVSLTVAHMSKEHPLHMGIYLDHAY